MRHSLDWTDRGWRVTTRLGSIAIAWAYYDDYDDALRALIDMYADDREAMRASIDIRGGRRADPSRQGA